MPERVTSICDCCEVWKNIVKYAPPLIIDSCSKQIIEPGVLIEPVCPVKKLSHPVYGGKWP